MRRLATTSSFVLLGVLGALLTGCPVWGPENNPRPDGGVINPRSCDRNDQCASNEYCNAATHECVVTPTCTVAASCPTGYACDSRGACVPGCATNTDCSRFGTGLVCNTTTRQCQPGGQCTTDSQCGPSESCVGGSCRPTSRLCQFNYQCSAGQECIDGACLATCRAGADAGAGACPSGQVCTDGHCAAPTTGTCNCTTEQVCVANQCVATCESDSECGTGNFCDHGACRPDTRRPPPFCTTNTDCASGSVCLDGVCRVACPNSTDLECMQRDTVNFTMCRLSDHICTSAAERNATCRRNADCASGQTCVNAACQ